MCVQTLLYRDPAGDKEPGEGQMRQCKDFSKLEEWAFALERNACFVTWPTKPDDPEYRNFNHCPPGSPFFEKMREHYGYDEDWEIDYELHKDLDGPVLSWN
jgi:hypothetical protein